MRNLKLVGLSGDGRLVVFVDDTGAEYAAAADDRLRAALRGDRARLGQLEIQMDSALRPRDIQARIRAGESTEAVAALAQLPVERILPFCLPVLAERQHVAQLAQRSHVRRGNVEGPSRRLSDVVAERLRGRGVDPDGVEWDAWRRDDGRWAVEATYQSGEQQRTALFAFDAIGRFSLADDDEARWLTGERQSTRKGPQPRQGRTDGGGTRRLSPVPDNGLLDLEDVDADVALAVDEETDDLTAVVRAVQDTAGTQDTGAEPGATGVGLERDQLSIDEALTQVGEPSGGGHEDARTANVSEDEPAHVDAAGADRADDTGRTAEAAVGDMPDGAGERDRDDATEPGVGAAAASPVVDAAEAESQPAPSGADTEAAAPESTTERPARRRGRGRGRASVPSWDEIMFGKAKDE